MPLAPTISSKTALPTRFTRPNLSRSARQDVRRAIATATELKLYSVTLHGVVWTLRCDKMQPPAKQPKKQQGAAVIPRPERSAQRLMLDDVMMICDNVHRY